jgi:lipid-A-disaccharide synthase
LNATLISAIRDHTQGRHFSLVGGAYGCRRRSTCFLGDLAIVGLSSISDASKILRRIREAAMPSSRQTDVLVIIDSPNSPTVARRACRRPRHSIVDMFSLGGAWRPGRARAMQAYVDHMLALLPFEPKAMSDLGGLHAHS